MTELDTGNSWRDRESSRQRAALLLACALILVWGINFSVLKAVLAALTPSGFLIYSVPDHAALRSCPTLAALR